jgi:hypothetical protein
MDLVFQIVGWTQGLQRCSVKKNINAKSKKVNTGWCSHANLAASSKEGCGSKRALLPMMVVVIMM